MNYKDFNLGDWIGHISGAIEDERELDGNEMRDLVEFLSTLEQEPSGDLISRTDLIRKLQAWDAKANGIPNYAWSIIKELPSVTPKEKAGHWKKHETYTSCSECGKVFPYCKIDYNFCPKCGARMESEK